LRLTLLLVALPLGACGADRIVTGSITPEDYRVRHPIVLAEGPVTLDIYASGRHLDAPSRARIKQFARQFRSDGTGRIEVLVPQGTFNEAAQRASLPAIRRALAAGGATGYVSVGAYPAADPAVAAPVRLAYRTLRATVASRCGEWPSDLASGSTLNGWNNKPYWNMGCAYQNALATQVADPRDLVEPRADQPSDVEMRRRAIEKVRQGADPSTTWAVKNTSIGAVGGGS
jgi:pilus assembly protein CpaD